MLIKDKYFYIKHKTEETVKKAVKISVLLFRWIFTVPVEKKTPIFANKETVVNKKRFTQLSFYLSLAFFFVITFSFLLPQTATAMGVYNLDGDPTSSFGESISKFIGGFFAKGANMVASAVFAEIAVFILGLLSFILFTAGMLFDYVVDFTVTNLTSNITSMKGGIIEAWKILRDLANMLFIFVLLYVSIATILQLSSVDTKRMLKNVVIVALLINFSMFFTEVVIDVTNTFATTFHGAIISTVAADPDYAVTGKGPEDVSISKAFMNSTSLLPGWFDGESSSAALKEASNGNFLSLVTLSFVLSVFLIILSFVLLAGAFFLIVRFVMFILLIILSPLAFVSAIIPQTSGSFQKWFKSLANNAMFAPIFLALLWVALVILQTTSTLPTGMTVASAVGKTGANGDIVANDASEAIFRAILATGFVVAALLISKTLSIHGASKATQIGSKWGRAALRTGYRGARGGGAFVANRTAGKYAAKRADSQELKDRAAKGSRWANMQLMAYDKLSKTGKKGGYRGVEDRRRGKAKKRAELYNTSAREKDRVRTLQEQAKASKDPAKMKSAQQERDRVLGVNSQEAKKRQDVVEKAVNRKILAMQKRIEKNSALRPLSKEEIVIEKDKHRNRITKNMEGKGFSMKEQLSQEQKLKSEYVKSIKDNILTNNAHIRESLRELKKEDKS